MTLFTVGYLLGTLATSIAYEVKKFLDWDLKLGSKDIARYIEGE